MLYRGRFIHILKAKKEMIANKSKDELIEIVYALEVENQKIKECFQDRDTIVSKLSTLSAEHTYSKNPFKKLIGFVLLPFALLKELNKHESFLNYYKLKTITMTQEQVLTSTDYINGYETKTVAVEDYMNHIERVTGVSLCANCGNTTARVHNDFQRRILNTIKNDYTFLAHPIKLTSSKYGSTYYNDNLPYYTFHYLNEVLKKMKADVVICTKRGLKVALDEIVSDLKTLESYIEKRKGLGGVSEGVEVEPIVEVSDESQKALLSAINTAGGGTTAAALTVEVETIVKTDSVKDILETVDHSNVEVIENGGSIETPDTVEEIEATNWAYGLELKKRGIHLKTIASELNVPYGGLSKILKDYEASLI